MPPCNVATINVGNNSQNIVFGDIANRAMDVGDMQKLGTEGKITSGRVLVHEVRENYEVQVNNRPTANAHLNGTSAENRINGVVSSSLGRYITPDANNPNMSTLQIPILNPASERGTVRVTLFNNNVLFSTGNARSTVLPPVRR